MPPSLNPFEIAAVIVLSLLFILSVPFSHQIYATFNSKSKGYSFTSADSPYEDEDGKASAETQKAYSRAVLTPKYLSLSCSLIGIIAGAVSAVLVTVDRAVNFRLGSWLVFGSWSLLLIQTIHNTVERDSVRKFDSGRLIAVGSVAIAAVLLVRDEVLHFHMFYLAVGAQDVLNFIQIAAASVCCISSLLLTRRPKIFFNEHPIDGLHTASALGSYTFSWAGEILRLARTKKTLDLVDLPNLYLRARSGHLQASFDSLKQQSRLWKGLLVAHYQELLFQFFFILFEATLQFAPQLAMYWLLKAVEQRRKGEQSTAAAWALVFALGVSFILASWVQAWLFWIAWVRAGQLVRSELSAMIFSKATRRKDVKGVQKAKNAVGLDRLTGTTATATNSPTGQKNSESGSAAGADSIEGALSNAIDLGEEDEQKTRQSTINLVGVDTKRVSDFAIYWIFIPEALTQLTVGVIFILNLIGWKSLLAGIAGFCILLPANVYVSKNFAAAQDELMKVRDRKLVVVTEALQGIRQIKFSAQEQQWQDRIGQQRTQELKTQWKVFCYDTLLISIWILGPVMLSAISLAVYATLNGGLSASVAFTTLTVMGSIELSLAVIPELISDALEAWVSVKRIGEYLEAPERDKYIMPGNMIAFENVSVAWPADSQEQDPDTFVLQNVNLKFPHKELSVISGPTGSGKSLLLAAIIGEAERLSGTIRVPIAPSVVERFDHKANKSDWLVDSCIAFVAQIPWIENATIKENILFGLPYDSGRFDKVISCCALQKDLEVLPDGVNTDIGANGINLSGGQRWRVTFARALYSRAGVLILDDIFSAVDAHVGRQLFEEALTGELGVGRTRILVTHHVGLVLPNTEYAVVLGEGTVQHAGSVEDLQNNGALEKLIKSEMEELNTAAKVDEIFDDAANDKLSKILSHVTERSNALDEGQVNTHGKSQPKKFTEDEKRETGSIKFSIYKLYFSNSGGVWLWFPLMVLFAGHQMVVLGRSWFIGIWTRSYATDRAQSSLVYQLQYRISKSQQGVEASDALDNDLHYYLSIYLGFSLIMCVTGTVRYFFVYLGAIRASRKLFDRLTYVVLRAPLRWLDITPVGRILNRFTADFASIDSRLGNDLGFLIYQGVLLVGIIIAGLFVSPWMLVFAVVLLFICGWVTRNFLAGAREVKRLESNAKSPIFEQFGSVLAGIGTIRAFDKTDAYIERMFGKIDAHARAFWYIWLFNRWLALRLNILGGMFAFIVAAIIVFSGIDASLAGFALSFALQYSSAVVWIARNYANVELNMNAIERVNEYSNIPIEKQESSILVPAAWPTEGRLQVSNFVAGYAPDLDPVLKGLTFSVEKNQRVGVVGRTGAGKSSLTLALFRFLEAREGSIYIDGIDISKISLYDLRSRLAIIPQDPVLFSGTVRSNLDPFDDHTEGELYDALERVHLIKSTGSVSRDEPSTLTSGSGTVTPCQDRNTNIFRRLSSRISEGGLNLSQGQRQLLCLARAIVSRPKIMVLDEATSAVDMATDVLIQRSIREEFSDATLIVIAHRLSTIADFDRILVMEEGRAVEFERPGTLLDKEGGVFRGMVEQSGERERLEEIIGVGLEREDREA